ncbi:hypothetical protein PAPYR_5811 [Paratrimastix pyriformis]|uniref:Uncharacterized protein n=1 Tax=Paratrimastix pyriformis TaxID=342808 RepID=A0ABQ8UHZ2_9EUKA|nr:hypothetical protein PAPYR_5811 [Paratrimastix pyriformis]
MRPPGQPPPLDANLSMGGIRSGPPLSTGTLASPVSRDPAEGDDQHPSDDPPVWHRGNPVKILNFSKPYRTRPPRKNRKTRPRRGKFWGKMCEQFNFSGSSAWHLAMPCGGERCRAQFHVPHRFETVFTCAECAPGTGENKALGRAGSCGAPIASPAHVPDAPPFLFLCAACSTRTTATSGPRAMSLRKLVFWGMWSQLAIYCHYISPASREHETDWHAPSHGVGSPERPPRVFIVAGHHVVDAWVRENTQLPSMFEGRKLFILPKFVPLEMPHDHVRQTAELPTRLTSKNQVLEYVRSHGVHAADARPLYRNPANPVFCGKWSLSVCRADQAKLKALSGVKRVSQCAVAGLVGRVQAVTSDGTSIPACSRGARWVCEHGTPLLPADLPTQDMGGWKGIKDCVEDIVRVGEEQFGCVRATYTDRDYMPARVVRALLAGLRGGEGMRAPVETTVVRGEGGKVVDVITEPEKVQETWAQYYEAFAEKRQCDVMAEAPREPRTRVRGLVDPISEGELWEVINRMHNGKATGPDRLNAELLKQLPSGVVGWLAGRVSEMIRTANVPAELKSWQGGCKMRSCKI